MPRTTAALVAFFAALCFATSTRADAPRIAVLRPDTELLRAVSLALAPWGLETMGSDAPLPSSSQPEAAQAAAELARELQVEALVWIASVPEGSLLWVFDARTGDVTTRLVPQTPPFDSASAAAVALSVKTVLRASAIAPPEERFGAPPAPPQEERTTRAPSQKPEPAPKRKKPAATAAPAAPAAPRAVAPRAAIVSDTSGSPSVAAAELGAGAHWVGEGELDYRIRLAGVLWFAAARRVGVSLEFSSGPGLHVDKAEFDGRYREIVAGGKLRVRLVRLPRFSYVVALGGALHYATLRGTLTADALDRDVKRMNGSVDLETTLNVHVTSVFYVGAAIGAAYFPSYRRYLVRDNPVFSPAPLGAQLTGHFGADLF